MNLFSWTEARAEQWQFNIEDVDARSQAAGGNRRADGPMLNLLIFHTFLQHGNISGTRFTPQPCQPKRYFKTRLFCAACSARVRSSVRSCAWNRVREPKVADRGRGDAAFCRARGRLHRASPVHSSSLTLPPSRNNVVLRKRHSLAQHPLELVLHHHHIIPPSKSWTKTVSPLHRSCLISTVKCQSAQQNF